MLGMLENENPKTKIQQELCDLKSMGYAKKTKTKDKKNSRETLKEHIVK